MRAWEIRDGFGLHHLSLADRELPTPGPGQVRVRVSAVSLNYRDLMMFVGPRCWAALARRTRIRTRSRRIES